MNDKSRLIEKYANALWEATLKNEGIVTPISDEWPDMTVDDAYDIQMVNIKRALENGDRITGKKIGLTSKAMQEMVNVDEPDYGHLLASMEVKHGDTISMSKILQPRVEAELAFILKEDLVGPKVTVLDVMKATEYIVPSLEIVASRIKDWKIKLVDTVADNASSGLYILGDDKFRVDQVDLVQAGMVLYKNGKMVNTGIGAAALGNPAYCVAWLANRLYEYGVVLKKGEVVLSGALSSAVSAEAGDVVTAVFSKLGEVSVEFVE